MAGSTFELLVKGVYLEKLRVAEARFVAEGDECATSIGSRDSLLGFPSPLPPGTWKQGRLSWVNLVANLAGRVRLCYCLLFRRGGKHTNQIYLISKLEIVK